MSSGKYRRPNLDTVLAHAKKAGRTVTSVTYQADGGFTLTFDGGAAANSGNEWDSVHEPTAA